MSTPYRKLRLRASAGEHSAQPDQADAGGAKENVEQGPVVQNTKRGQTEELQAFYQQNLGLIYRYVYSKVGNREEAEDVTSQVFMKAVHSLDSERGPEAMQKWLFQVARTTIADYWRGRYRISSSSLDELLDAGWEGPVDTEYVISQSQPSERVQRILNALPEHYQQVLACRFLFNLSVKETALSMGLSEANVKVLQFRALKRAAELEDILETSLPS